MSHLQYYAHKGVGEQKLKQHGYQQAVRVGDRIECSGQGSPPSFLSSLPLPFPTILLDTLLTTLLGGWDPQTGEIHREINKQIEQAFANVDLNLRDAGGKGWEQVFRVNSYHVPMNDEALEAMTAGFKKWMPRHSPIWTCVGVPRLGDDDMKVEIEVVAHDPK
ncbi:uncharacterized protein N0V89_007292 [Didymosphaeria variabile]|uniref:YjgF-like protein n=1 Tax=Didymosphaeria variabile TaxID=1932322 RepID=A0A9W8XJB6_9PLEO|nr:uncharacterized protein N0V89_007292 [Didymosphaeria variabile]KAJ4351947.1 hypothetical protein N0V89_007292 [Didymosphaeria variabile]